MALKIDQRKSGSVTVLEISGKIVLGEAADQLLATTKELVSNGEKNLVYNMTAVLYVDSAGLGVIVKCLNATKAGAGRIKLVNVSRNIRDLFRITKLETLFEFFDDESAAVASFG